MKHRFYATFATVVLTGTLLSSVAMAQTASTDTTATPAASASGPGVTDPGHPRINQVDQRLQNQQNRINAGAADGQINQKQETRDENRLQNKEQKLSTDEAKNGGHITKAEQKGLNKGLNKSSRRIHRQRHGKNAVSK